MQFQFLQLIDSLGRSERNASFPFDFFTNPCLMGAVTIKRRWAYLRVCSFGSLVVCNRQGTSVYFHANCSLVVQILGCLQIIWE